MPADEADEPLSPFLKWAGGKRWLIAHADTVFPEKFNRYIEPFLGSGAVFFHLQPQAAILSDLNAELITTYDAIRSDWESVQSHLLKHQRNHSADYYYKVRLSKPRTPHTIAARMIYLNRTCWNGLYRVNLRGEFNVPKGTKSKVILETDNFKATSRLLKNTTIKNDDFSKALKCASEGDFVFVDPPYTVGHSANGFIKYNEKLFSWSEQVRLKNEVKSAAKRGATIVLTNANNSAIAELYKGIGQHLVLERRSVISGLNSGRGKYSELIIRIN